MLLPADDLFGWVPAPVPRRQRRRLVFPVDTRRLEHRVSPDQIASAKTLARDYLARGGTFRGAKDLIIAEVGISITHAAIRYWARTGGWTVTPPPKERRPGRPRHRLKVRDAKQDAPVCRHRCERCLQVGGEGHLCRVKTGHRLTIFCGGYL